MRSLTSRVGRSGFADLPDYASCKGDIASPPGRDHGACSFVANQQVWVQQIFGGRPDSKRGLSRSFTSSKLQSPASNADAVTVVLPHYMGRMNVSHCEPRPDGALFISQG